MSVRLEPLRSPADEAGGLRAPLYELEARPAVPPAMTCNWCDRSMAAYIAIPGERPSQACGKHLEKLEPLVMLRALEVGLV
jgi:hypothetical protein